MDEEKEQNNGQAQEPKSVLHEGTKKLKKQAAKKFFRKIIAILLPKLLIAICIIFGIYLLVTSISHYLDLYDGKESKDSGGSAIEYTSGETKAYKIIVDPNSVTEDGAYNLKFKFEDEDGNICTEEEAIKIIKRNLLKENEKIKLNKFSDSELKIIGTLMANGLETGKYSEEQLKALAIFIKAEIAGKSFDLRNNVDSEKEIKVKDLRDNDKVYGTLELHKTTPTEDEDGNLEYKEIKLEFVKYEIFKNMIEQKDSSVLEKFSIDDSGNVVIAKSSTKIVKYTYQDGNGNPLSGGDMGNIDASNIGEDENEYVIAEYSIPIDYKLYIKKYIATYGFLSDLLISTTRADFCEDIAEMALNSKIVLNIREEKTTTYSYEVTNYTQTTLEYDYVSYEVTGYDITDKWQTVASGVGSPSNSSIPRSYGWHSGLSSTQTGEGGGTQIYRWKKNDEEYILRYLNINTNQSWTLSKNVKEKNIANTPKESGSGTLIVGGHISESYDGYSIDEDYTSKKEYNYTVIVETTIINYTYDIDLSEIDCWFLTYKRPYASPTAETKSFDPPENVTGEFPEEATTVQETTNDSSIIDSNGNVQGFKKDKEKQYIKKYPSVEEAECKITALTIKSKTKTSSNVQEYIGTRTTYKFGDESELDTTTPQFKNMVYVNDLPSYTSEGPQGFLYIYDGYITRGIDLCLQNDAEKELFEMLESNEETIDISAIMRFLLYIYDGIDRGVTDLDKNFKIIDVSLVKGGMGASAFGCNMTREEFIAAAEAYGESILSGLAAQFYDICTLPEYNVNPCFAYAWAAVESAWGSSAVEDKNLFQIGTYTDQTSGKKFASYEDAIKAFCQWVVNAANPSTSLYSFNYKTAQEYATENKKFDGTPQDNIYAQFCTYGFVGYVHTGNARACIEKSAIYLYGVNECNHNDEDATTTKERADWALFVVATKIDLAKEIFGKGCILGGFGDFPEYQQSDPPWGTLTYGGPRGLASYPGNNGQRKTVGTSGCGCCALANILSGYTGEAITPDVLLDVLNDEYPGGNYYAPGQGSYANSLCGVLYRYDCTYFATRSRSEALKALQEGNAILGGEAGHFLAFVPVTSQEAEQGYVFRILDSARGHGGLYKSFEEADKVVKGACVVTHIIYPPK